MRRLTRGERGVDAVLSCYALSVMTDCEQAWRRAMRAARPQARVAVVDLGLPTGHAAVLAPLARLACVVGGADPHRDPWRAVLRDCVATSRVRLHGGHVVVTAGTISVSGSAAGAARAAPRAG